MEPCPAEEAPLAPECQEEASLEKGPAPRAGRWRGFPRATLSAGLLAAFLAVGASLALLHGGGERNLTKADVQASVSEVANGVEIPLSRWNELRDFVANIRKIKKNGKKSVCSGIVSGNKVITAKHCADDGTRPSQMRVKVSSDSRRWKRVTKIDLHPRLDVAVLTFSGQHRNKKQVILDKVVPEVGESIRLAGFGRNHDGGVGTELHDTAALRRVRCNKKEGIICAGSGPDSKTSSCGGDSGGPWFQQRDGGKRIEIVGVNSFGFGGDCGAASKKTGLVSVASAITFLRQKAPTFDWDQPSHCTDADNGAKDEDGDGCAWYTEHDHDGDHCGKHDDGDFDANIMCCRCGGGRRASQCTDADNGAKDAAGDACAWYTEKEHTGDHCGKYDDSDFDAKAMCCSCGGGHS